MNEFFVFTGSAETEEELRKFLRAAITLESGVPRELFDNDDLFRVMTSGRSGEYEAYHGSKCPDDTGGFFEEINGRVYLTDKAKACIATPKRNYRRHGWRKTSN